MSWTPYRAAFTLGGTHEQHRTASQGTQHRTEDRGAYSAIVAQERSLQQLRRAHKLTKKMGEVLGIGQDSVSRLGQRSDLLISTLRSYVEVMCGKLSLSPTFRIRNR